MQKMAFAAGFAFAIGLGGATTAQAGLLDFIFGWRDRTDIRRAAETVPHPQVTISPRRRSSNVESRAVKTVSRPQPRSRIAAKPAAPALSPREQFARTIDPVENPRWYLEDQTLRRGDVLVLDDRVLVFTGGAIGSPKSYVALSRSKLLSRAERARIASMTRSGAATSTVADAPESKPRRLRAAFRLRPADRS